MIINEVVFSQLSNVLKEKYLLADDNFRLACEIVVKRQYKNFNLAQELYDIPNNDLTKIKNIITNHNLIKRIHSRPNIGIAFKRKHLANKQR